MTTILKAAITEYPHTAALLDGTVTLDGYDFDFSTKLDPGTDFENQLAGLDIAKVPDVVAMFRTQSRELRWDISEMGITTALVAKEYGVPFTAIPVFATRRFDHMSLAYNARSVSGPNELEGKRIGMRSPNVPDVLWSLALLQEDFGVDLSKTEWIVTGDEHIEAAVVEDRATLAFGESLDELVETGQVSAIMAPYAGSSPDVRPGYDDIKAAEREWFSAHGYIPIHHVIIVKNELLEADPELASRLFDAFVAAKQPMLDRLARGEDVLAGFPNPRHAYGFHTTKELLTPEDPVPYGIEPNRKALEALVRYSFEQGAISEPYDIEEIFKWP